MSAVAIPVATVPAEDAQMERQAEPKARILSISANPADHAGLNRMIDHKLWQLVTARNCRSAVHKIDRDFAVVFSECALPDGTWRDILDRLSRLDAPPQLVVTSRLADAYLWSEVLNLGGFDVLAKPLNGVEVRQVLAAISRHRAGSARVLAAGAI